jgi:hypothetical protein
METLPASSSPSTLNPSVRTWTVLCHASAFLGFLIPALGQFVGPLIVWLWKRDESPEIDAHGKESLNFQLSVFIYTAVFAIVCFVLMFVLIGFLLVPLIALFYVANVVLVIIASLKANDGVLYRYPLTLRLIK